MNFPWASPGSSVPFAAAALGAAVGLYLFFRGFWLLQHKGPMAGSAQKTLPAIATITTALGLAENDKPAGGTSREIIRLSPISGAGHAATTQQGKIAAALLKAGMANPASWTEEESQGSVRVATVGNGDRSTRGLSALDIDTARVVGRTPDEAELSLSRSGPVNASVGWKPALMMWGGPILTLLSIYILAERLGWL